jgi:penicillin-binding protein 1B
LYTAAATARLISLPIRLSRIGQIQGRVCLRKTKRFEPKLETKPSANGRFHYSSIIGLVFLVLGVGALYLYFSIGKRIDARLSRGSLSSASAVYTLPFELTSSIEPSIIIRELNDRNYREVTRVPKTPGEFQSTGEQIIISPRSFQSPVGSAIKQGRIIVDIAKNEVREGGTAVEVAFLEPRIISHLSNQEVQVKRHQPLNKIPEALRQAVISIEDERFYSHMGVDLVGIARALFANIRAGRVVQGGSTLTQQLAKNLLFGAKKTIWRKIREALAALYLERRLNKDEILELYLNEVYLGQEGVIAIHGVSEGAFSFFRKNLSELTISECATLAGIIQAPSSYAPRRYIRRTVARRDMVLAKMREIGYISELEYQTAKRAKLLIAKAPLYRRGTPHYVDSLRTLLHEKFDVDRTANAGLKVYSGIDIALQECAENAVTNVLNQFEPLSASRRGARVNHRLEGGLVAIEPRTGLIKAWVGGREYGSNQFCHVSQAKRQIGSTIKPFLYLTALDSRLNSYKVATASSIVPDRPIEVQDSLGRTWEPENYDEAYRGDVTLRYALEHSLNMPAVYVSQRVGISSFANTVRRFRLANSVQEVPSLALGSLETTLLSMTTAFAALANGGFYVSPRLFLSATDSDGNVLGRLDREFERISTPAATYVLTNILQGVVERGTGTAVRKRGYKGEFAGKTGTSNEARDAWFIGYDPELAVGAWIGYDDNSPIGLTGGRGAAPIVGEFMNCAASRLSNPPFEIPDDVVFANVDIATGQLASKNCPSDSVVREVYVRGTEPSKICQRHGWADEAQEPVSEGPARRRRSLWDVVLGR